MPNFNDHESNQSQRHERHTGGSSGWQSSNDRRGDRHSSHQGSSRGGYARRDDDRRGGYGRNDRNDRREDRRGFGNRSDSRGGYGRRDDDRRGGYGRRDFHRDDDGFRNVRGGEEKRQRAKELQYDIPESITADSLPSETRNHLRGLNSTNADIVARHLAYAGEMMDIDPEVAYQHAKAAYARAARIDIVREAVGISAYLTNRYSEALTELRAYRRFSNDYSHVALEADSERGLGRSEKALRFISEIPLNRLDAESKVELAIVTSGAKADTGDCEGGLALIEKILVENLNQELASRVELVKADRLEELGRTDEAQAIRAQWEPVYEGDDEDTAMVLDLEDVLDEITEEQDSRGSDGDSSYCDKLDGSDAESGEDPDAEAKNGDADMPLVEELRHELGADFDPEEWEEEIGTQYGDQNFEDADDFDDTDDFDFDDTDDFDGADDFDDAHDTDDAEDLDAPDVIGDAHELTGENEGKEY